MNFNDLIFGAFPYAAMALLVAVAIIRWRWYPFSVSSLSSQLLESRRLYWGSVPFHWGISLILLGHLLALIIPGGFEAWNGASLRLYVLEATGLALGLWAAFGLAVLIVRRLTNARVRAVTSPMDHVVLAVIGIQIITGIWIAIGYRWGSLWGTAVFVPYMRSVLTFRPRPELVDPLPLVLQAHVLMFWVFIALFPFTRLVHIITLPLGYLTRPWQQVIRMTPQPSAYHPAPDDPLGRVP